jgi:hypothetical protein
MLSTNDYNIVTGNGFIEYISFVRLYPIKNRKNY